MIDGFYYIGFIGFFDFVWENEFKGGGYIDFIGDIVGSWMYLYWFYVCGVVEFVDGVYVYIVECVIVYIGLKVLVVVLFGFSIIC